MARKPLSKKELKRRIKNERYYRYAKKLRATHAFGDLFKPSHGVDLRSPGKWSPQVKARVTRYAKELGPLLAAPTKTKRYFREDHLEAAIEASPQERSLPGQKAALFPVESPEQKVEIEFTRDHEIRRVVRAGIEEMKIYFDMDAFIKEPVKELERTLADAPGRFFKFITGIHESRDTFNADDLIVRLERYIERYDPTEKDLGDFLYGIKAYPGIRTITPLKKRDEIHKTEVAKRQRERLKERAAHRKALTKAEQRSIRLTGRAGRVK